MSLAQRFERRLEGLVGGAFARVFKGQVEPVEIGTALQREAADRKNVMGNGQVLCPNRYRVTLAPSDHERLLPWEAQLTNSLAELVQEYLDENRWSTIGDIEVYLARDDELHTGVFGVASRMEAQAPPRRRPYDSLSLPITSAPPGDYGAPPAPQSYLPQPQQPPLQQPPQPQQPQQLPHYAGAGAPAAYSPAAYVRRPAPEPAAALAAPGASPARRRRDEPALRPAPRQQRHRPRLGIGPATARPGRLASARGRPVRWCPRHGVRPGLHERHHRERSRDRQPRAAPRRRRTSGTHPARVPPGAMSTAAGTGVGA